MELLPWIVVFGTTGVLCLVAGLAIRGYRRTPRARARREVTWTRTGQALLRLDTAIEESDIELGLAGAMYGGTAPRTLAAARAHAANARDDAFARYQRALENKDSHPGAVRDARHVGDLANRALLKLENAQLEHQKWLTANADAPAQVAAARGRLSEIVAEMGDPTALERDLATQFAATEWAPVKDANDALERALAEAERAIARAEENVSEPGRSVMADLAAGEKQLRAAEAASLVADQAHRAVLDASIAVASELASVRADITKGVALQKTVPVEAAQRFGAELERALADVEQIEPRADREPTAVIAEISRIRDRLDVALGNARTARDRIEGARNALPATTATARRAIAHAEAIVVQGSSADARVRLTEAHDAMASSRSAEDAVSALDAVRRAIRHAEDAEALANYARTIGR
ncbi:hypothetical protein [Microbacterium sp. NC79]|uniref:hypothetical protein n=1 Tax=Microbacterium sp. NC79 TaxID=2851009 RepID=UPI001C2BB866|nr:hypothetical protein [Microbacterium sp. NC79]MBV0896059.1 hypothetical protein [Microbacterium sp. NC79]